MVGNSGSSRTPGERLDQRWTGALPEALYAEQNAGKEAASASWTSFAVAR